jgi:calcineurin-like phosphoesterase
VEASSCIQDPAALRILFLGDVFGEPGRRAVAQLLPELKERLAADFIIINGENAAAGRGLTPKLCIGLLRAGATVVTLGDHCWDQYEIMA